MNKILEEQAINCIEKNVLNLLNDSKEFSSQYIINSPRAVGDIVQEVLESKFNECIPRGLTNKYNKNFARRAMADYAFEDKDGNYCIIDFKTHNIGTKFNMPNLTSVERLSRFYEDDKNYFIILLVEYFVENGKIRFNNVMFVPIEKFDWSCLTIGALGWGQIQIANANYINVVSEQTRKEWMIQLCDALDIFYPKELEKINQRLEYFKKVRQYWENK